VDEDGDYWLMGRIDDVVNVSGHRIGTAEVESALVSHPKPWPRPPWRVCPTTSRARASTPYVTLKDGVQPERGAQEGARQARAQRDRPHRRAGRHPVRAGLPKTRSGKIMRRILKKIAANDIADLGDTSTLAEGNRYQVKG
jgi:acetyl-CoA synthetase